MFSFFCSEDFYQQILEVVYSSSGVRMSSLQSRLKQDYNLVVTTPTLYRKVAELIEQGAVIRYQNELLPNLLWLETVKSKSDFLKQDYLQRKSALNLSLASGEARVFSAGSLAKLDPIWNEIHLELGMRFGQVEWYGYNSHPWYMLGMGETEKNLHRSFVATEQKYYCLMGNDTFLTRLGVEQGSVPGYHTKIEKCPKLSPEGYACWASEEYLIEVSFPKQVTSSFSKFFNDVERESDFDSSKFESVFHEKYETKLKLTRSVTAAAQLKDILFTYFT